MSSVTIQCPNCSKQLRLARALLDRLQGRAGKLPCKGCGARLRLDARNGLEVSLAADSAASRDSVASSGVAPSRPVSIPATAAESVVPSAPRDDEEVSSQTSAAALLSRPPPLPREMRQQPQASSESQASPDQDQDGRDEMGSLSPQTVDEEEAAFDLTRQKGVPRPPTRRPAPPRPWQVSAAPRFTQEPKLPSDWEAAPPPPSLGAEEAASPSYHASLFSVEPPRRQRWPLALGLAALVLGVAGGAVAQLGGPGAFSEPASQPPSLANAARSAAQNKPEVVVNSYHFLPAEDWQDSDGSADTAAQPNSSGPSGAGPNSAGPSKHSSEVGSDSSSSQTRASKSDSASPSSGAASTSVRPDEAFDRAAASLAMQEATAQASACRKDGDPSGVSRVVVTFAPSGRATRATISGPPFAGTATGGCVARIFRGARVPSFEGSHVTVVKTVTIR